MEKCLQICESIEVLGKQQEVCWDMPESNVGLWHWFYTSSAAAPVDDAALRDILHVSRAKNSDKRITGLLLFNDGTFTQYIEGPKVLVDGARNRIEADKRHKGIIPISHGPIEKRLFPEYSMSIGDGKVAVQDPDGFRLSLDALDKILPDHTPPVVRVMMQQTHKGARNWI